MMIGAFESDMIDMIPLIAGRPFVEIYRNISFDVDHSMIFDPAYCILGISIY